MSMDIAADIAAIFSADEPGVVAATYAPKAGGSISTTVRMIYGSQAPNNFNARSATILLDAADVAAPADGDTVTIGSVVWTVRIGNGYDLEGNGYYWQVGATRAEGRRFERGT